MRELAGLFLKLGLIGFGGPAAHIAMMEDEVVRRREWLSREQFLDLLGATNLIPGPNSTELAIHVGQVRAGWRGQWLAGSCFILPAMLIVTGCAWVYVRFGALPQAEGILYGVKPVVIAIVLQAMWGLGRSALKSKKLAVAGVLAAALSAIGVNELMLLFGTGLAIVAARPELWRKDGTPSARLFALPLPAVGSVRALPLAAAAGGAGAAAVPFALWPMFLVFLKVGSVLFGSGYVLLAFLRADLVDRTHWLTESQLLDAVAVGQVTPGPVFTTATFIGYLLAGLPGATLATVGIFLPAFVFVGLSGPLVPRLRRWPAAGAFLDGLNVASLALMGVVTWRLGRVAVRDWATLALAAASLLLLWRYRLNSVWLVAAGAAAGSLVALFA